MELPNGPLYSCQGANGSCAENQSYSPDLLHWYPILRLWLCENCADSEFVDSGLDDWPSEHHEATIRLDVYLQGAA